MEDGLMQNEIEFNNSIVYLCQRENIDEVLQYVKDYKMEKNITYYELYLILSQVLVGISSKEQLSLFLLQDIPNYLNNKKNNNIFSNPNIAYRDFCEIVMKKISSMRQNNYANCDHIDMYL